MTNRIFSVYNLDDGGWQDATIQEALQTLALDDCLVIGAAINTGIKEVPSPVRFMPNAREILERYDECCYENTGEWSQDNTGSDKVSGDAIKQLNELLHGWATNNLTITFFEVDHIENFDVTQEMIDAYRSEKDIPLPEFKYKEPSHD